jgi:hypothetical protein
VERSTGFEASIGRGVTPQPRVRAEGGYSANIPRILAELLGASRRDVLFLLICVAV